MVGLEPQALLRRVVLAVVAIGLAIGYGVPASRDAFALVLVLGACAYVIVRVWRIEHRY